METVIWMSNFLKNPCRVSGRQWTWVAFVVLAILSTALMAGDTALQCIHRVNTWYFGFDATHRRCVGMTVIQLVPHVILGLAGGCWYKSWIAMTVYAGYALIWGLIIDLQQFRLDGVNPLLAAEIVTLLALGCVAFRLARFLHDDDKQEKQIWSSGNSDKLAETVVN